MTQMTLPNLGPLKALGSTFYLFFLVGLFSSHNFTYKLGKDQVNREQTRKINELKQDIQFLSESLTNAESQRDSAYRIIHLISNEHHSVSVELEQAKSALINAEKQIADLKLEIAILQQRIQVLIEDNDQMVDTLLGANETIQDLEDTVAHSEVIMAVMNKEIMQAKYLLKMQRPLIVLDVVVVVVLGWLSFSIWKKLKSPKVQIITLLWRISVQQPIRKIALTSLQ